MFLKEDPDKIGGIYSQDPSDPKFGDSDGLTFFIFTKLFLYASSHKMTHGDIIRQYISNLFENTQVKDFGEIKIVGNVTSSELATLRKMYLVNKDIYDFDRSPILENLPHVIQGRIWKNSKNISFWNDAAYILFKQDKIYEFIRLLGQNPKQYKFEVKNNLVSYEKFSMGQYEEEERSLDLAKLHTLPPENKKEVLRNMGARPKEPRPLSFMQKIRSEGMNFKSFLEVGFPRRDGNP